MSQATPLQVVQRYIDLVQRDPRTAAEYWAVNVCPTFHAEGKHDTYRLLKKVAMAATRYGAANVFRLSDGLAEQLAMTSIDGVDGNDIRLPFDGLWLQLPATSKCHYDGSRVEIVGLHEMPWTDKDNDAARVDAPRALLIVVIGTPTVADFVAPPVTRLLYQIGPGPLSYGCLEDADELQLTVDGETTGENGFMQLATNALLYITSPNPDVKLASGSRPDTAWDEAVSAARTSPRAPGRRKQGGRVLWNVGESVKRLRVTALDVLVRGHWRRQSHGPRHSLRKMIWVQPHIRMPTGAPTAGHDYRVNEIEDA